MATAAPTPAPTTTATTSTASSSGSSPTMTAPPASSTAAAAAAEPAAVVVHPIVEQCRNLTTIRDLLTDEEWARHRGRMAERVGDALQASGDLDDAGSVLMQLSQSGFLPKDDLATIVKKILFPPPSAALPSAGGVLPHEGVPLLTGGRKNFKCAIIVSPPETKWDQIQSIRQKWDKAYDRWMPHINMMWPFVQPEAIDMAAERLTACLSTVPPFKLTFSNFNHFEHSKSCVMWLQPQTQPPTALVDLANKLVSAFPFFNDLVANEEHHGFHPHLTCGQFAKNQIDTKKNEFAATFKPIEFVVDKVYLISRKDDDEPFSIKHTIPLGGKS
ncbi:RNA ligase/cyclic nucleotide phosphodiesterase [Pelomyxa schiedti]|nr:RNA ligase/cyclic nucleotide phosphodiesterase [Pelomyxa schiedti]